MFSGGIGPWEILLVLVIVLVIFGPKRLPSLGRQLGSGMREFKESITGDKRDDEDDAVPATITASAAEDAPRTPADAEQTRA